MKAMSALQPCAMCKRHYRTAATRCPFCGDGPEPVAPRVPARGRLSRAAVFAGAVLALPACGGKAKPSEPIEEHRHGGGGCVDPDPDEIARLEKQRDEAASEEERRAIEQELEGARMPVCMPYGAPPARRRVV